MPIVLNFVHIKNHFHKDNIFQVFDVQVYRFKL